MYNWAKYGPPKNIQNLSGGSVVVPGKGIIQHNKLTAIPEGQVKLLN